MEFRADIQRRKFQEITVQKAREAARKRSSAVRALKFGKPASTNTFYGSRRRETSPFSWQPGEFLPTSDVEQNFEDDSIIFAPESPIPERNASQLAVGEDHSNLVGLLKSFQGELSESLSTLTSQLGGIETKMEGMEKRQKSLEDEIHASSSSSASAPSASASSSNAATPTSSLPKGKRRRLTPTALQSKVRMVYSSFDEDKEFAISEPINSKHNSMVVQEIVKAIGSEKFSEEDIRKGCRTYKKTLSERAKQTATPVKRKKNIRSMQQRSYERRGKRLKGEKERKYWQDVTPCMMSDEEKQEDEDVYVRHAPEYRSELFNKFIAKLESRCDKASTSQPRKKRVIGSPITKPVPVNTKNWLVKREFQSTGREDQPTEPETIDSPIDSSEELV